jgi:hypothetical protein
MFDKLLEEFKEPKDANGNVKPYMLFGVVRQLHQAKGDPLPTPDLACFELIGSNQHQSRVNHYRNRGFKLLKYSCPLTPELREIKRALETESGLHDQELQALRSENEKLKGLAAKLKEK